MNEPKLEIVEESNTETMLRQLLYQAYTDGRKNSSNANFYVGAKSYSNEVARSHISILRKHLNEGMVEVSVLNGVVFEGQFGPVLVDDGEYILVPAEPEGSKT